jgi:hypothetical protein
VSGNRRAASRTSPCSQGRRRARSRGPFGRRQPARARP